jgi:hypothetical protein
LETILLDLKQALSFCGSARGKGACKIGKEFFGFLWRFGPRVCDSKLRTLISEQTSSISAAVDDFLEDGDAGVAFTFVLEVNQLTG